MVESTRMAATGCPDSATEVATAIVTSIYEKACVSVRSKEQKEQKELLKAGRTPDFKDAHTAIFGGLKPDCLFFSKQHVGYCLNEKTRVFDVEWVPSGTNA